MTIQIRCLIISVVAAGMLLGGLPGCAGETPGLRNTAAPPTKQGTPIPLEPILPTLEISPTRSNPSPTSQPTAGANPALTFTPEALVTDRSTSPTGTSNPMPQDPYILGLVQAARLDLATRLKIPVEQVQFVSFESIVWPDGSLGCPKPDMLYAQVQQDGYRITLAAQEARYAYHGGGARAPFLCEMK